MTKFRNALLMGGLLLVATVGAGAATPAPPGPAHFTLVPLAAGAYAAIAKPADRASLGNAGFVIGSDGGPGRGRVRDGASGAGVDDGDPPPDARAGPMGRQHRLPPRPRRGRQRLREAGRGDPRARERPRVGADRKPEVAGRDQAGGEGDARRPGSSRS